MTHKSKIKELIGMSLRSYHIKVLQQIDRIEKKNNEQNHKIDILINGLDYDYLNKTEEGSVVSLEHSIVEAIRLNKAEVLNNTEDINDNIIPYLMDMDYRVVCLQLSGGIENISMAKLFGGTYKMLQRDILSKRYSVDEYRHRLEVYLNANKVTEDEYKKLGGILNE